MDAWEKRPAFRRILMVAEAEEGGVASCEGGPAGLQVCAIQSISQETLMSEPLGFSWLY